MDNTAPTGSGQVADGAPAAETLVPRSEGTPKANEDAGTSHAPISTSGKTSHRRPYRPSHKATFIGLIVVITILAVNAGIIGFVLRNHNKASESNAGQVTISQNVLDGLGVNRSAVGDSGIQLTVGPDARFNGKLVVGGDVSVGGALKLSSKFSAADANLTQLEAGNTSLGQLNVNGDSTVTNLSLRNNLLVTGTTNLQGPVTLTQLLTVNNSVNVVGNLAIGGTLTAATFSARSLVSTSTLTIGGHIITSGSAPSISQGSVLGSNGTVSVSGNDAAGTVAVNIGVGASSGILASIGFRTPYSNTPHVVVTPIGADAGNFYINRNANGFSIVATSVLSPGGYAFDYIVEQ